MPDSRDVPPKVIEEPLPGITQYSQGGFFADTGKLRTSSSATTVAPSKLDLSALMLQCQQGRA